jgi:hypothetical protein
MPHWLGTTINTCQGIQRLYTLIATLNHLYPIVHCQLEGKCYLTLINAEKVVSLISNALCQ